MILRFPVPDEPWGANQLPTTVKGRIATSRRKAAWRDAAYLVARSATARRYVREQPPSYVQVTIPFRTNRRRDPHNYTSTVVKAVVDGLRSAGLFPDDTADYVTVLDPLLIVGDEVTVTITPRNVKVTA